MGICLLITIVNNLWKLQIYIRQKDKWHFNIPLDHDDCILVYLTHYFSRAVFYFLLVRSINSGKLKLSFKVTDACQWNKCNGWRNPVHNSTFMEIYITLNLKGRVQAWICVCVSVHTCVVACSIFVSLM